MNFYSIAKDQLVWGRKHLSNSFSLYFGIPQVSYNDNFDENVKAKRMTYSRGDMIHSIDSCKLMNKHWTGRSLGRHRLERPHRKMKPFTKKKNDVLSYSGIFRNGMYQDIPTIPDPSLFEPALISYSRNLTSIEFRTRYINTEISK